MNNPSYTVGEEYKPLPTSAEELKVFVAEIINEFNLPDTDQTLGMICQEIMHMGRTVDKAPLSIFAAAVKKQLANDVVYPVLEELRQKQRAQAAQASAPASNQVEPQPIEQASTSEQQSVQDTTVQGAS